MQFFLKVSWILMLKFPLNIACFSIFLLEKHLYYKGLRTKVHFLLTAFSCLFFSFVSDFGALAKCY